MKIGRITSPFYPAGMYIEYGYRDENDKVVLHREEDLPAFISRTRVAWYQHGIRSRRNSMPTTIRKYTGSALYLYYENNGKGNNEGPTVVTVNHHPIFNWYSDDNQLGTKPIERYDVIRAFYNKQGRDITEEVEHWIKQNNLPLDYQDWINEHRMLYKLTFS